MNEQKSKWPYHNKTIVVKMAGKFKSKYPHRMEDQSRTDGKWKSFEVEAGRIFTGPNHGDKAYEYVLKKRREYKERTKEEMGDERASQKRLDMDYIKAIW